jgi:hypothetical protein
MVNSKPAAGGTASGMTVEMWPIEKLIPYARNPRQIPQTAIDKVAASIQEFGFRQPIVVDQNGVIIVGHVRLLAAQKLRLTKVPVHVATERPSYGISGLALLPSVSILAQPAPTQGVQGHTSFRVRTR